MLPFLVVVFRILSGVLVTVIIIFRGVIDNIDGVLLCVIGVRIKVIDIACNSILGGNITIFLISEVLFNPVSFIVAFYWVCLVRLNVFRED